MINPRTLLAAACQDRDAFDAIAASDEPNHFTGDNLAIWKTLVDYFGRDRDVQTAALDTLGALAVANVAAPKSRKRLLDAVSELGALPCSSSNVREALAEARRERIGTRLAVALSARKPRVEIEALIGEWQETFAAPEGAEDISYEEALRSRNDATARIQVRPLRLNKELGGGVMPGHHVIIFARPEIGKSALAVTMATGFARKGLKVLYFGNEDPAQDLMVRAITAFTKRPRTEVDGNALNEALASGLGNIRFVDISPGSIAEIEGYVRRHRPACIVVDQLRNIHAGKAENLTQRLDTVAQGIRALAKRYGLVAVSVTQAGDSARNKAILDDGDIDNSNTGIPAAADVLIGMGADAVMRENGSRMLTLCKNKVSGTHPYFTVRLDGALSLVTSHEA